MFEERDDYQQSIPGNGIRVNVHDEADVRYWWKEFNCSAAALRRAVAATGVSAKAVRSWLAD